MERAMSNASVARDDYGFDPVSPMNARRGSSRVPLRPEGKPFEAELELGELDGRERPGEPWTARARTLSRSSLVLMSRRMCYPGRMVLVAVHRIDEKPVGLLGKVHGCDYEADGLYRVELDLLPLPVNAYFSKWLEARGHHG